MEMDKEGVAGFIFLCTGIYGLVFSFQLSMGKWNELSQSIPLAFLSCFAFQAS
jgi:hypothetical protein